MYFRLYHIRVLYYHGSFASLHPSYLPCSMMRMHLNHQLKDSGHDDISMFLHLRSHHKFEVMQLLERRQILNRNRKKMMTLTTMVTTSNHTDDVSLLRGCECECDEDSSEDEQHAFWIALLSANELGWCISDELFEGRTSAILPNLVKVLLFIS